MKGQINTIRRAVEAALSDDQPYIEACKQALTALAQIEAAVGEPVAFVTDADVACFGKGAQGEIAALLHRQGKWCHPLFTGTTVAQQPQEIEVQCPVCNHKFYEWPNDKQPQAEAVPVVDRVYEAAKRLVDHADFQLGGVLSAKSKARDIPSNAASKVKARHLASLRDALAKAPQQAEAVPLDNETKTMKLMGLVDDLIEADPDRAERFIETVLGRNALQKRLKQAQSKEPQAEAVPPGFEVWLRTVCFQRPTPEAYDLAKAAWRAAIAQQKGQP